MVDQLHIINISCIIDEGGILYRKFGKLNDYIVGLQIAVESSVDKMMTTSFCSVPFSTLIFTATTPPEIFSSTRYFVLLNPRVIAAGIMSIMGSPNQVVLATSTYDHVYNPHVHIVYQLIYKGHP